MSGWEVGDIALCVDQSGWVMAETGLDADGPRTGQVLVVRAIKVASIGTFLGFAEWPRHGFHHAGFVKVTPDDEMIEAERKASVPA